MPDVAAADGVPLPCCYTVPADTARVVLPPAARSAGSYAPTLLCVGEPMLPCLCFTTAFASGAVNAAHSCAGRRLDRLQGPAGVPPTSEPGGRAGTLLKLTVAATFVIELPATALIVAPWRPLRVVGAALQAFLQARRPHARLQATCAWDLAPCCSALGSGLSLRGWRATVCSHACPAIAPHYKQEGFAVPKMRRSHAAAPHRTCGDC